MEKQNILVIDIGSFQIKAYLAEADSQATVFKDSLILKSEGFSDGRIQDSDALSEVLLRIKEKFPPEDGRRTVLGVSGIELTTRFALGSLPLGGGTVSEIDVQQVAATPALTTQFADSEVLHIVPKNYRLDGCVYEDAPLKRHGRLLECECSAVTIDRGQLSLLKKTLLKVGLEPDYIVANLFMINSLISAQLKDSTYILLSFGADNTEAVLCEDKRLIRLYSLPCGSRRITAALQRELGLDFIRAEQLKRYFAQWNKQDFYGQNKIIDCSYENSGDNNVQYDRLYDIIENEARGLVEEIHEKIGIDLIDRSINRVYYTGGASLLYNIADNIKTVFELDAVSVAVPDIEPQYAHPEHFAGYGAAVYVGKKFVQAASQPANSLGAGQQGSKPSLIAKIRKLFNV